MNVILRSVDCGLHAAGNGEVMGVKSENCKSKLALIILSINDLLLASLPFKEQSY